MMISLRFAMSGMAVSGVGVVSAILISVSVVLNTRIVDDIGTQHAVGLGVVAHTSISNFFDVPIKLSRVIQRQCLRPGFLLPQDDPSSTWFDRWEPVLDNGMMMSNTSILTVVALLSDNSTLRSRVYNGHLYNQMYSPAHGAPFLREMYAVNYSDVPPGDSLPFPFPGTKATTFPSYINAHATIGTAPGGMFWYPFSSAAFPTLIVNAFLTTLTNSSGAFLGFLSTSITYEDVDKLLQIAVNPVDGATAFLVDTQSRVFATSMTSFHPSRFLFPNITSVYNTSTAAAGVNCAYPHPLDPERNGVCVQTAAEYAYRPLLAAVKAVAPNSLSPGQVNAQMLSAAGDDYFLVVQRLETSLHNKMDVSIYLLYPRDHVLNGVKTLQTIVIVVGVVVACVVLVMTALVSFWMTSPLILLIDHMSRTARLQHIPNEHKLSMFSEIRQLQEAYVAMSDQLFKIRRFVPRTIFGGNSSESDDSGRRVRYGDEDDQFMNTSGSTATEMTPQLLLHASATNEAVGRLDDEPNTFVERRCSVVVCEVTNLPDDVERLARRVHFLMDRIVGYADKYGGVIEQLNPRLTIVTFNAHRRCHLHENAATEFALHIATRTRSVVAVDTSVHRIGTCGARELAARVMIGEGVDVCRKLTSLAHLLKMKLLVTDRVAEAITGRSITLLPVDAAKFSWSQSPRRQDMIVYAVYRSGTEPVQHLALREAFLAAHAGNLLAARDQLLPLVKPVTQLQSEGRMLQNQVNFLLNRGAAALIRPERSPWDPQGCEGTPTPPPTAHDDKSSTNTDDGVEPNVDEMIDDRVAAYVATEPASDDTALFPMYSVPDSIMLDDIPQTFTDVRGTTWLRSLTVLGRGCGSAVFRMLGPKGAQVAGKAVTVDSGPTLEAIRSEMELISKLRHENLVQYISVAILDHYVVMLMELVLSGSLRSVLRDFGPLPPTVLKRVARDVLRGLQFLHSQSITHCDLKPDNVLMTAEGVCKLADFGSSLVGHVSSSSYLDIRGTLAYVAPEVAKGQSPQAASDMWSFGIMYYELATGRHPFRMHSKGPVEKGQYIAQLARDQLDLNSLFDSIAKDPSLSDATAVLSQCIQIAPESRPTAVEMLAAPIWY